MEKKKLDMNTTLNHTNLSTGINILKVAHLLVAQSKFNKQSKNIPDNVHTNDTALNTDQDKTNNGKLNLTNSLGTKNRLSKLTGNDLKKKLESIIRKLHETKHKTSVAYLVQGRAEMASKWIERLRPLGDKARLFYHSYDNPCKECIYEKKTSFATGRNLLLRHALNHLDVHKFKYFSFCDMDLEMECKEHDDAKCWKTWNDMILSKSTNFLQVIPKTEFDPVEATNMQTCLDPEMVTLHHSALHLMTPQPTHWFNRGWWYNTHVHWAIIDKCCPLCVYSDDRWKINNPEHSEYPTFGDTGFNISIVYGILEYHYPDLGPWSIHPIYNSHHCATGPVKSDWTINAECERPLWKLFKEWYVSLKNGVE